MENKLSSFLTYSLAFLISGSIGVGIGISHRNSLDYKAVKHNLSEIEEKLGPGVALDSCRNYLDKRENYTLFRRIIGEGLGVKKASEEYLFSRE